MKLSVVDALAFPQKAVVALVNHKKKKQYVVYTSNTIGFFMKTIQQLRDGTHPIGELNIDKADLVLEMYYNLEHIQKDTGLGLLIGLALKDTYNRNMPYMSYDSPKYLKYKIKYDLIPKTTIDFTIFLKININRKWYTVGEYPNVEAAKARYDEPITTLLTDAYLYQAKQEIV